MQKQRYLPSQSSSLWPFPTSTKRGQEVNRFNDRCFLHQALHTNLRHLHLRFTLAFFPRHPLVHIRTFWYVSIQIVSMSESTEKLDATIDIEKSGSSRFFTLDDAGQRQIRKITAKSRFFLSNYFLHPACLCLLSLLPTIMRGEGFRPKKKLGSTSYLDALRGCAAIIVVFHHTLPYWNMALFKYPFFIVLLAGRGMVDIFFVISGYVLGFKLLKLIRAKDNERLLHHFASSIFRRYLRLYLPAFVITFVSMLLVAQGWKIGWMTVPRLPTVREQFWDWLLESFRFANPFSHITGYWTENDLCPTHRYNEVLWTIPVEVRLRRNACVSVY
jgi:hypothetical protein